MAVYKPTLCYPFSNGVDIRTGVRVIGASGELRDPAQSVTCRVETSNVSISGYSIALYSSAHEQIFPHPDAFEDPVNKIPYVSPISELQYASLGYDALNVTGDNSGVNGSTLRVPFFRAARADTDYPRSRNAIYYAADYVVSHMILDTVAAADAPAGWPAIRDSEDPLRPYTSVDAAESWQKTTRTSGTYLIHYTNGVISPSSYVAPADPSTYAGALFCDGEPLIVGDLVAVLLGETTAEGPLQTSKGGIYEVACIPDVDGGTDMIFALRLRNSLSPSSRVVVWQGATLHNTIWEVRSTGVGARADLSTELWYDSYGHVIPLDARGAQYQWEITLYQGMTAQGDALPILPSDATARATYGGYVDYTTIGPQWFDNIVTGGQIMGSTPERLQLADRDEQYLPAGTDSDPLVLQDTFCSIFPLPSGSPKDYISWSSVSRFPVHDYDARYGHVYPYAKTLLGLSPPSAEQWCAFYEHSTNPQEILDTDIVDYAYAAELPLSFWHVTDGAWVSDPVRPGDPYDLPDLWKGVSVTERYLVVGTDGGSNPNPTGKGGQILLTAQSRHWQNGVWQIKTMEAALGNSTSKKYYLTRAAKYETWGDFIGRIVYAAQPASMNYTSLAAAGAANLWNYQDVDMQYGRGDLWFSPERPILLFRDKLWHLNNFTGVVRSVDLNSTYWAGSGFAPADADGARQNAWQIGDYVADKTGTIYYVAGCENHVSFTLQRIGTAPANAFIYVVNFAREVGGTINYKAGGTVYTWDTSRNPEWVQTWELHRAKILKNNLNYTYVSPWVKGVVDARMSMKLLSPGTAVVAGSNTTTDTIRIQGLNDVVYRLDHAALETPMAAYNVSDPFIPYRYNICSYFRTSEPNPFIAYETPYLRLFVEQNILTNLTRTEDKVASAIETAHPLMSVWLQEATTYIARKLNIAIEYQQFNHTMWESYQWKLYAEDGVTLLQDTGRRYDGLIQATFYGLANELQMSVPYYATVIVENSVGDTLEYGLRFAIAQGHATPFVENPSSTTRCWFTAAYDCNSQSNLITFQWADPAQPAAIPPVYSVYRREYEVYEQPGERFEGYLQSSTVFTRDAEGHYPLPHVSEALYEDLTPVNDEPAHIYYVFKSGLGRFVQAAKTYREFKGPWEPVVAARQGLPNTYIDYFRDFNIANGRSYQYVIYPVITNWGFSDSVPQTFANYSGLIWESLSANAGALTQGSAETSPYNGGAVISRGDCWSLVELIPEKISIDAPILNHIYHVDNDNVWLFRYDVETGEQAQNLARNEFANLGQYPKFGFGRTNYASGNVSAQLGSELVCSSKYKYIERLPKSRLTPLSTNEKAAMLKQWQAFMYSRNPKLLRDIKGQSWIVQIVASSNRSRNYYPETPDTISFQWKQIDSPHNTIVYGEYGTDMAEISRTIGKPEWGGVFAGLGSANAAVPEVPYRVTWGEVMWSFESLAKGTEARIKLGEPPISADDYTYAISGAATGGVGKAGTITDHSDPPQAVMLPSSFECTRLYLWVLNANAPLRIITPVEATITATYDSPYVVNLVEDTTLTLAANHTAYDLIVITNNAIGASSNPRYAPVSSTTPVTTRLDFTFPDDYGAPADTSTLSDHIQVEVLGSGGVTYAWVRDDATHGHLTLTGVSAPLRISITGVLLQPGPTNLRRATSGAVLEWDALPGATEYRVSIDGVEIPGAVVNTNRYNYAAVAASPGVHAFTVYAAVGDAYTRPSNNVLVTRYSITSTCTGCGVDTSVSNTSAWETSTAVVYYDFPAGGCPGSAAAIGYNSDGLKAIEWQWISNTRGRVILRPENWNGGNARLVVSAGLVAPTPTITLSSYAISIIASSATDDVVGYYILDDTTVLDYVTKDSTGTRTLYNIANLGVGTHALSVVAVGGASYMYGTSGASNTVTITKYPITVTLVNATAASTNSDAIWESAVGDYPVTLTFSFDGTTYTCPTTGPTVTGATGVWTYVNSTTGSLSLTNATGAVSFTVAGQSGGSSTDYSINWLPTIVTEGEYEGEYWDVHDQYLAYSFSSNGMTFDTLYVDEDDLSLYYIQVGERVLAYDHTEHEWTDPAYRTIVSSTDPSTAFTGDWEGFYYQNTSPSGTYTTSWDAMIEAYGTAGSPPVAWDLTEQTLSYTFTSNGVTYTSIYLDEMGCMYYSSGGTDTIVYDAVHLGWISANYRTIMSTTDPATAFVNTWATFYSVNTNGSSPSPSETYTVAWNFVMETEAPTDVANYWSVLNANSVSLNFRSNNTAYSRVSVDNDGSIYYGTASSNTCVYDYIAGWALPAYRTIVCDTNPELAFIGNDWSSFYRANTVQTYWRGSLDIFFEVDGSAIWDVRDATLSITFVSNGTTYSSIYIDPEGSMYYGGTMVYEYQTGWVNDEYRIITTAQPATTAFNHGDWLTFYYANTGAVTYWRSRLQPEGEGMSYDVLGHTMYCAFMCNGTMYAALTFDNAGNLYYNTAHQSGGTKVYDVNTGWVQAAYRLIATVSSGSEVFNADSQDWSDFYDANANITDGD